MNGMNLARVSAVLALGLTACVTEKIYIEKGADGPRVEVPRVSEQPGPNLNPAIFPAAGARSFITANDSELLSSGTNNGPMSPSNGREALGGDAAFNDSAEAPPPSPGEPMPEPDPTREIVEADLFKVDGDLLYVLNRHRGLVILDLSIPDEPKVRGRLPFDAVPVEMYVRDGRAYIVMSDYFEYWMYDPDADPLGFHGSQVLIADVSDADHPKNLGSLAVDGEITDTRMVGDVLYAVSKRRPDYWRYNTADWEDTTWVVSLDLHDPADIHEKSRITFAGTSTLIHVAPHAVFVAATDPNFYLYDPGHEQETLVTYVDISDPNGALRLRGKVYVPGMIQDKFKMDYFESSLRVFASTWTSASSGELVTVDVSYPDALTLTGRLPIVESEWGSLAATRFSGERAYAMTYNWPGPEYRLRILDLSSAASPRVAGTLPLLGTVTHFEVRGDNTRLLALGRRGYPDYRTSLGLYDVSNPNAPRLLADQALGDGYSYSSANNDYKALKIFDDEGLILLPLSFYEPSASRYFNGTQLVDWTSDSLDERGRVTSLAPVERAFLMGERIVAFSSLQVQVIDASNRDAPVVTAGVDLVRNVYDIFSIQGHEVQLVGNVYTGKLELVVVPFAEDDDVPALARLELPFAGSPYCMQRGNLIHMIGWEATRGQVARTADFAELLAPVLRGELALTDEFERTYSPGYSYYYYYWSPYAGLPLENRLVPFTVRRIVEDQNGRRDFVSELRLVDLTDPDHPRIADNAVPMNDFPFINKVTHGNVLYSTHVEQATSQEGNSLLYHVRAFVDRIDVSDPDNPVVLPALNTPGWLVDVADDGKLLFTVDYQWDEFGRRRNSLDVLRVVGNEAVLAEVLPVSDQVNRAVFRDRTVWLTTHKYPWWGVHSDTVESRQPYTVLSRVTVGSSGAIDGLTQAKLPGYHLNLLDVAGPLVFMATYAPYGVVTLDARDAAAPSLVASHRTIGYISRIVVEDGAVYSPMGYFGVRRFAAPGIAPQL